MCDCCFSQKRLVQTYADEDVLLLTDFTFECWTERQCRERCAAEISFMDWCRRAVIRLDFNVRTICAYKDERRTSTREPQKTDGRRTS